MYGHAFEAFKTIVTDPDQVFNRLQDETNSGQPIEALTDAVKEGITKNVRRRMTPQPIKIRADVELTCFAYDGVLHIQVQGLHPSRRDLIHQSCNTTSLQASLWSPRPLQATSSYMSPCQVSGLHLLSVWTDTGVNAAYCTDCSTWLTPDATYSVCQMWAGSVEAKC